MSVPLTIIITIENQMISILHLYDAELLLLYKNHYICLDIILKTMINCIN